MDKKERALFRKMSEVSSMIASNVDEDNVDNMTSLIEKLEIDLRNMIKESTVKAPQIWRNFSNMTEEEIRQEFSDVQKYPDLESIKSAVKGFLELRKVSKVKTRETLIEHIISTYRRGEFISKIGREDIRK